MTESAAGTDADTVVLDDDRPVVALAGLPAALMVSGLMDQLEKARSGYTPADFLSPILAAASLLRDRYADNPEMLEDLGERVKEIMAAVVQAVGADWGADLAQLGLDPQSANYEQDVAELYRFFVSERLEKARELAYTVIFYDRRRLADKFRKTVEKRNQSTSEARKVFASFDDVVIWSSMREIVAELRGSADWSLDLADVLARLGGPEPTAPGFLAAASGLWTQEDFAARYLSPAVAPGEQAVTTVLILRDRWLAESPKK